MYIGSHFIIAKTGFNHSYMWKKRKEHGRMSKQQLTCPGPSSTKSTLQWVVRTSSPGHIAYWTKHEEEVWVKKQQQRRRHRPSDKDGRYCIPDDRCSQAY